MLTRAPFPFVPIVPTVCPVSPDLGDPGTHRGDVQTKEFSMKILVAIAIIALVVLFCVGAVNSNYNCVTHLCGSLTHAINFVGDFLHTEMAGVNIVARVL